jgi:cobalt-zinc-cadmium efflux system membrane fusion protein
MIPMHNRFVFAAFVLFLSIFLHSCKDAEKAIAQAPQPILENNRLRYPAGHPQLLSFAIIQAQPMGISHVVAPARVVWNEDRTQRVMAPFAGRVARIVVDMGQEVKPGTLLAEIASPEFGVAQAETTRAQADVNVAQKNLERQKDLFELGIVAKKELEQAQADAIRAKAELDRANAKTALYGGAKSVDQQLALRSEMRGLVVERNINPGQEVKPESASPTNPALFLISDPYEMWLQIDAREEFLNDIKQGQWVQFKANGLSDQVFKAKVVASSDFIDPVSRVIKMRALVSNPQRLLKAEMLGSIQFDRSFISGVLVPAKAVFLKGAQHWVFVETAPSVFEPREVAVMPLSPQQVVITKGLQPGQSFVSDNVLLLAREFKIAQDNLEMSASPVLAPAQKP